MVDLTPDALGLLTADLRLCNRALRWPAPGQQRATAALIRGPWTAMRRRSPLHSHRRAPGGSDGRFLVSLIGRQSHPESTTGVSSFCPGHNANLRPGPESDGLRAAFGLTPSRGPARRISRDRGKPGGCEQQIRNRPQASAAKKLKFIFEKTDARQGGTRQLVDQVRDMNPVCRPRIGLADSGNWRRVTGLLLGSGHHRSGAGDRDQPARSRAGH